MAGTGALRTWDAASSDYDQDSDDRPNFGRGAFIPDSANRMGLMAWFAEAAYRRDVVDSIPARPQHACRYLQGAPAPTADMPPGWSRWVFHQHRAASELPIRSCVD